MKRLAIYMFYDAEGVVGEFVPHKLRALRDQFAKIIVVVNGKLQPGGRTALLAVCDQLHVRTNEGFDVHAYRDVLINVVGWANLAAYDELHLLNYTFYGPIFPFNEMFAAMDAQPDLDFWGVSAFNGPVPNEFTNQGMLPYHLQSHWLAIRSRMFGSAEFRSYWAEMPPIRNYIDSILNHESRFTKHFESFGFRHSAYINPTKYGTPNAVMDLIDLMVQDRCPIFKRRTFFQSPEHMAKYNVELRRALDLLREKSTYDHKLIWRDITRVTPPRVLHTNAVLLKVLNTDGEVKQLRKGIKIAVLAHAYYPDMLGELMQHANQIPVAYDVFLTTPTLEKKRELEQAIQRLPKNVRASFREVRVVPNRGRDVSAHLIGLRDVVLTGGYDYVCRLHSKRSPQDAVGMARHFKEHLFENLLGSKAYVSQLLALFESDPSMGMAIPPIIHIGYPTLGHAWFTNRPGAERWAKKLGITIPFDDYTPVAAYGSMYWYRPDALHDFFTYDFSYTDFPEEPNYGDGGTAHVLERLVAYACFNRGYFVQSVMTTENAAKNYVSLEYRLQKAIAEPMIQMKALLNQRLFHRPLLLKMGRTSYQATRAAVRVARRLGIL
jgi:lipopolysaccharide biosynthesis protein